MDIRFGRKTRIHGKHAKVLAVEAVHHNRFLLLLTFDSKDLDDGREINKDIAVNRSLLSVSVPS